MPRKRLHGHSLEWLLRYVLYNILVNRESLELIEALEANSHLDPWTVIKDLKGWKLLIGWRHESKIEPMDILKVFANEIEVL